MTLTKDEAKEWIPILQAFVDGKQLQIWNGITKLTTGTIDNNGNVTEDDIDPEYDKVWIDIDTSQLLSMTFTNHADIRIPSEWYRVKPEPEVEHSHANIIGDGYGYDGSLTYGSYGLNDTRIVDKHSYDTLDPNEDDGPDVECINLND